MNLKAKNRSVLTKLLNSVSQSIPVNELSRETGKPCGECMATVLSDITTMFDCGLRSYINNGIEYNFRFRRIAGIGREVALDIYKGKFLYVGGIWY